jgi:hypothetical protein
MVQLLIHNANTNATVLREAGENLEFSSARRTAFEKKSTDLGGLQQGQQRFVASAQSDAFVASPVASTDVKGRASRFDPVRNPAEELAGEFEFLRKREFFSQGATHKGALSCCLAEYYLGKNGLIKLHKSRPRS